MLCCSCLGRFTVFVWHFYTVDLKGERISKTMKIKIAYDPSDEREAAVALAALLHLYPDAKARKSEAHPPFQHIYLTTKRKKAIDQ